MKHFLVINPHSFFLEESLNKIISDIEDCFSDGNRADYRIYISRYPRDAIAAVHRYITNCPTDETVRVYAIGGDGILFECLNGMVDFPNAELTSVPYGNANDFVGSFGEAAKEKFLDLKKLSAAPSRPVDIIHCGSNYAIIETNIGLVGQTVINSNRLFPHLPEKWLRKNTGLAYSICAVLSFMDNNILKQQYSIVMDGEDMSGNYSNIHIANAPCDGGGLLPSPYARPDNGFLQVILANTNRRLDFFMAMKDYISGRFEKHKFFIHKQCKVMEIKSDALMRVQIDGEGYYAQELKLEIIPKGIKFFTPEGLDFFDYSCRAYKGAAGKGGGSK